MVTVQLAVTVELVVVVKQLVVVKHVVSNEHVLVGLDSLGWRWGHAGIRGEG